MHISFQLTMDKDICNADKSIRTVEKIKKFMKDVCDCALGENGRPCFKHFTKEAVVFNVNKCYELSSGQLDLC